MLPTSLANRLALRGRSPLPDHSIARAPTANAARAPTSIDDRPSRALLCVFDMLVEGVLLVDGTGGMFYRNPALERMLLDDADRGSLLREMRQLALWLPRHGTEGQNDADDTPAAAGALETTRDTRTTVARYRMRAAPLDDALLGTERAVIVTLERLTAMFPSPLALADRFNLTACEAGVAQLLAQGHSNGVIAKMLSISPHTARHHTESVLLKLNVHSRAEVGGKLLGTRRPSGPMPAL
jgi:DNA-binding CsgD family transcriptional regulator